jgi:GNAT superfamily N-acetyltransferase
MPMLSDAELYDRGASTLLASWEEYARGATGASLQRSCGVAAAVFPHGPEREVYNNALFERGLPGRLRGTAIGATEAAYSAAGVSQFAAWVHESDLPLRRELERRGYRVVESTLAMGMELSRIRVPRPQLDLGPSDWAGYLRAGELPPGLLRNVDPTAFHVRVARLGGQPVTTGIAYDHGVDCGIYNVGTLAHARRRGLGTALTALLAYDALARGCQTASLQSTPMAEDVYAAVGFRGLGRFLEYGRHAAVAPSASNRA